MRVKIHFFLCPAVCNILDLREPEDRSSGFRHAIVVTTSLKINK
jgi:hypothetical protein